MQADGYPYGLSRAYNYLGVVALLAERNGREAAAHFERALAGARAVGNRFLEPRLLMNLGVSFELFGERARVAANAMPLRAIFVALARLHAQAVHGDEVLPLRRQLAEAVGDLLQQRFDVLEPIGIDEERLLLDAVGSRNRELDEVG